MGNMFVTVSPIHRRNLFASAIAGLTGWLANQAVEAAPAPADRAKIVYHLSDLDKVNFVLGNIQHHFDGMGGAGNVTIELVVHGPALKAFRLAAANPDMTKRVVGFVRDGLTLAACVHTLKAQNLTLADLLPGFTIAERGGVVRIAELQAQGYAYLRP
jgi:uncharacterized protein